MISVWMAATPLILLAPMMARWPIRIFLTSPSSTMLKAAISGPSPYLCNEERGCFWAGTWALEQQKQQHLNTRKVAKGYVSNGYRLWPLQELLNPNSVDLVDDLQMSRQHSLHHLHRPFLQSLREETRTRPSGRMPRKPTSEPNIKNQERMEKQKQRNAPL